MEKVILILVDGMRPDSLDKCGNEFIGKFMEKASCNLSAKTVMPSVTLPCHMSLFHSVSPQRHGILTNTYVPQVRPVDGLLEELKKSDKTAATFYNWEELRDLGKPSCLSFSCFISQKFNSYTDIKITEQALKYIESAAPDFLFLYLGETDETGHKYGWMTSEYLSAVDTAWKCIERVFDIAKDKYNIIVTADHGGHNRTHGYDIPEDMTIPIMLYSNGVYEIFKDANIIDIAPTIAKLIGINPNSDWEGKMLIRERYEV